MKRILNVDKYEFIYDYKQFNFYSGATPNHNNQHEYLKYFRKNGINIIVRLCENIDYDEELFESNGIKIIPLYYIKKFPPRNTLYHLDIFFNKWYKNNGTINIFFHCTTGYDKTPVVIGYLVCKHMKYNVKKYLRMIELCKFNVITKEQSDWLNQYDMKNNSSMCCVIS